jgi:esterase/lipase
MKCLPALIALWSLVTGEPRVLNEQSQWFKAEGATRGIVLLAHGLNMKPSKMDTLAQFFQSQGLDVYRIALSGHRGDLQEMRNTTQGQWLREGLEFYNEARNEARTKNVPLYLVGFSLGGLLYEDLMNYVPTNSQEKVIFDKAVLFAPAITVRTRSKLIKLTQIFNPQRMILSLSPLEYRANPEGTSVGAYKALFSTISDLHGKKFEESNIPTLVFIDPQDELVSYKGILKVKEKAGLNQWNIQEVSNRESTLENPMHHIITDDKAVGAVQWRIILDFIRQHLQIK